LLVSRIDDAPEKLSIRRLARLAQLAEFLVDCVEGGSLGQLHAFAHARAGPGFLA
jgi:hypothetical protein